jgi:hypothetical protein
MLTIEAYENKIMVAESSSTGDKCTAKLVWFRLCEWPSSGAGDIEINKRASSNPHQSQSVLIAWLLIQ